MKQKFLDIITFYIHNYEAGELFSKIQLALTGLIQIIFLGGFVLAFFERAWVLMFVSSVATITIWLPLFLAHSRRIHIPIEFEFLLAVFIYGTLFLGEVHGFYTKFWWWDLVLHAGAGIAFGFIGFLILYSLYKTDKLSMSPFLLSMFAFAFALMLGSLWEIFEFGMDQIFGLNMQKTGLMDTMWDMVVNTAGALLVSISGYAYMRYHKRGVGIFEHYLTAYLQKNK